MGRSVGADITRQCVEHARRAEPTPRGSILPERCLGPGATPAFSFDHLVCEQANVSGISSPSA